MADEKDDKKDEEKDKGADDKSGDEKPPLEFDSWLKDQPAEVQTLLTSHTTGLKSALDGERTSRKDLDRQLKALSKKLEAGSEAQQAVDKLRTENKTQSMKADFYEAAHREGATNLKLAFIAGRESGLIDDDGEVDWPKFKTTHPELFGAKKATPPGKAGSGTDNQPGRKPSMNEWIRQGR